MKIFSSNIHFPNPIHQTCTKPASSLNFRGLSQDVFVPTSEVQVYNPYEQCYGFATIPKDLSKPAELTLPGRKPFILNYNPASFGYLTDKQSKEKIKTMILKSNRGQDKVSYHFLSEDLKKVYGYVSFIVCKNPRICDCKFETLFEDRHDIGIVGPRLIVDYLKNFEDDKIGGVGKLADKIAVTYCRDNNLPFNVVSVADRDSHMAHYLRGKRFYPVTAQSDPYAYKYLIEHFGKADVNEILKDLVSTKTATNEKIKPPLGFLEMYLPKIKVAEYLRELKMHPIIL